MKLLNFVKLIVFILLLQPTEIQTAEAKTPVWLEVDIGIIGVASADIVQAAMEEASAKGYDGLLIRLDTPGGSLEATRAMVKAIMAADYPIVVWVGPSGSRAGSAGAFITLAAHIAAMAPGTNIGASHPIDASGQNLNEEAGRKITNDTTAFIESIAEQRKRNVEMARSFVMTSTSITDVEALENKVIDLVAKDVDDLYAAINGKEVELHSGKKTSVNSQNPQRITFKKTLAQKGLEILSNPNLFYLLFLAGIIGLSYELTHPGVLFPGVAGAICLVLALIATSVLPVNLGFAALLLLGIALMAAELFVPSFGILGIGGFIAFLLGSIFLVDPANEQGLRVSLYAIAPGAIFIVLVLLSIGYLVVRSSKARVHTGIEAMVGEVGEALQDFSQGFGKVRVAGEIWHAEVQDSGGDIHRGDRLKVLSVKGLKLIVTRV